MVVDVLNVTVCALLMGTLKVGLKEMSYLLSLIMYNYGFIYTDILDGPLLLGLLLV